MTTYHIFFRSQYSGDDGSYTLYRDAPSVQDGRGRQVAVFSNAFLTRDVPSDGFWHVDINDAPYAFCGTAPFQDLSPGDVINVTGQRLVKVLPNDNGSTVTIYNNKGFLAFRPDVSHTAPPGTFGVVTEADVPAFLKPVAGFGGMDSDGLPRPLATFKVDPSADYYIKPNAKFYLGPFASQSGALIRFPTAAVEIDFETYPGLSNAIITRKPNGSFELKVVPAAVFAMETTAVDAGALTSKTQLIQLKNQVKLMGDLVDAALGISTTGIAMTDAGNARYLCTAQWKNNPSLIDKAQIVLKLTIKMQLLGYKFQSAQLHDKLSMVFTLSEDRSLLVVLGQWVGSIYTLGQEGKFVTSPAVSRVLSNTTLASQSETFDLPPDVSLWPRPQWRCSIEWLEGPSPSIRERVTTQLIEGMGKRGYLEVSTQDMDQKLSVDFYHSLLTDLDTAQADWPASRNETDPWLRNFHWHPTTEPLFHTQDSAPSQTNGVTSDGVSADPAQPSEGKYLGSLQWLEGPNKDSRDSVISQINTELKRRVNVVNRVYDSSTTLVISFTHDLPSSLPQAQSDWLAAYNSINEYQKMFAVGPQCFEDGVVRILPVPSQSSYIGCLTWLEGPGDAAKDNIIRQLKASLETRKNEPEEAINIGNYLMLPFSHNQPSSLPEAKEDWLAAFNSITGNQRMLISAPFCEENREVGINPIETQPTNGTSAPAEVLKDAGEAPAPFVTQSMSSSIEEKKKRALELLRREGLVGFGGLDI